MMKISSDDFNITTIDRTCDTLTSISTFTACSENPVTCPPTSNLSHTFASPCSPTVTPSSPLKTYINSSPQPNDKTASPFPNPTPSSLNTHSDERNHNSTMSDQGKEEPVTDTAHLPPSPKSLRLSSPLVLHTPAPSLLQKRANPKRLSLSLFVPPNPSSNITAVPACPTPISPSQTQANSTESTPFTPGPPKTPSITLSLSRTRGGLRRPSLLSLITQPPTDSPFTPTHPYTSVRRSARPRTRASTLETPTDRTSLLARSTFSASAHSRGFPTISEVDDLSALKSSLPSHSSSYGQTRHTSPASSVSSESSGKSLSTVSSLTRRATPYEHGPVEIVPGVFLGAEDNVHDFIAGPSRRMRIINVAQEVEDPFMGIAQQISTSSHGKESIGLSGQSGVKGKEKVRLVRYQVGDKVVEYAHLRWSHGEAGLADLPKDAELSQVIDPFSPHSEMDEQEETFEGWGFWKAVRWLETARRDGIPVLIHCQCGVSRSATLVIAYVVALAAAGLMPEHLGHLTSMQDAYDLVKSKSPWAGPNVSLVFQLVEFARNCTQLISSHLSAGLPQPITSFPTANEVEMSEAEWARRRREFDLAQETDSDEESDMESSSRAHFSMEGKELLRPFEDEESKSGQQVSTFDLSSVKSRSGTQHLRPIESVTPKTKSFDVGGRGRLDTEMKLAQEEARIWDEAMMERKRLRGFR
ncbi:hypothetical protein M231_00458 [Tremella mesenterica]|uniref:protein-tyrosine-phosphatase n=1 Tax=Tremella mesenterica TaxID=5217 RepID=A0A4Q1BVD5_TREME|nr:hypothetical protein M231_00458 [Tremella mesenterica]